MMQCLDLSPPKVAIKVSRSAGVQCTIYYLTLTGEVVDMSGFSASIVVTEPDTGMEITSLSKDLGVVSGSAIFNNQTVAGAQGVYINLPPVPYNVQSEYLVFEVILNNAISGEVVVMAAGVLEFQDRCGG